MNQRVASEGSPASTSRRAPARGNIEANYLDGIRNHWYAIIESSVVGDKPVAVKRLGEDLVVWRGANNSVSVFKDYCPHRGARLSLGRLDQGHLQCWYHGWIFDKNGKCVAIPSEGGKCAMAGEVRANSYPTVERAGMIFAYMSDDDREPHIPCPNPYELESPDWSGFIVPYFWQDVIWLRVLDNLSDPLHASFLHANSYSLGHGKRENVVMKIDDLTDGSSGFTVSRVGAEGNDLDWIEFHAPNWIRTEVPYPKIAGPGGPMRIVGFITPIDQTSCAVYFFQKRKITGWKWLLWKTLWGVFLRRKALSVVEQDRAILHSQRNTESRSYEFLAQSDIGVARMRRMLADEWKRQQKVPPIAAE